MNGKVLNIRDYDYDFLIESLIILDGQGFERKIPKRYQIVRIEDTQFSQTVYVSKKNDNYP